MSKIVVAARQSVESQLHVGKKPTKNQAVKNDPAKDLALQTPKRDGRATTWKKKADRKRIDQQSESSKCLKSATKFANFIQKRI